MRSIQNVIFNGNASLNSLSRAINPWLTTNETGLTLRTRIEASYMQIILRFNKKMYSSCSCCRFAIETEDKSRTKTVRRLRNGLVFQWTHFHNMCTQTSAAYVCSETLFLRVLIQGHSLTHALCQRIMSLRQLANKQHYWGIINLRSEYNVHIAIKLPCFFHADSFHRAL